MSERAITSFGGSMAIDPGDSTCLHKVCKPVKVPFITVVMPVRNEEQFISDTLGQLLAQEYPADRFEIIVADGMSDDRTREIVTDIAHAHPQVCLLDNPKRHSSAGRNIGFREGRGDVFLVVDGHCFLPSAQLFHNIADCLNRSGSHCLGRPQPLDPPGLSPFQSAVALVRGSRLGHGADSLIYGEYEGFASPVSNGAVYVKEVFATVGWVDESFDAAEDVEFNYRIEKAGLTCYTSPKLTSRYYPRESLRQLFRQMQRYGIGRYRFIRKHPEALTVSQLIPACFTCGLLLLFLALMWPSGRGVELTTASLGALYGLYVLIVVAESLRLASSSGWQYLRHIPFIFFTVHFGLGFGFLKGAVIGQQGRDI